MTGICEDASELEKLIHECEFENQQYVKLIEKEKQHLEALEREIKEKEAETERLKDAVTQLDNDTKHFHKQFTINRDNCESLKKTTQVLTDHFAAMNKKLELATLKRKQDREENERLLKHYRSIWESYKTKYESFPKAQRLHQQRAREKLLKAKCLQNQERLDNIRTQVEELKKKKYCGHGDVKNFIIKLAEMYVQTMHTVKEIEVKKREIERRNKMMEATEANKNEAIKQLKEIHLDDKVTSHDEMESDMNQTQTAEAEDLSSPMISVFSGRSDTEEEMQMGEIQSVEQMDNLEGSAVHADQGLKKPQTWLANYQDQNQRQATKREESSQHEQIQKANIPHIQPQQSGPQPPFVAFHNAGHDQGSGDTDASVSIHLETRSSIKPGVHETNSSQTEMRPRALQSQHPSRSSCQQNVTGFTNPSFQNTAAPPKFTVLSMPARQSATRPLPHALPKSPAIPQLINRTSAYPVSRCPPPGRVPIPSIQNPRISSGAQLQPRLTVSQSPNIQQRLQKLAIPNQRPVPQSSHLPSQGTNRSQLQNPDNTRYPTQQTFTRPSTLDLNQVETMSSKVTQQIGSQSVSACTAGYIPASPTSPNTHVSLHSSNMIQKNSRSSPLTPQPFQSTSSMSPKATQQIGSQSVSACTARYIPASPTSPNTHVSLHSSNMIQKNSRSSPQTPQPFQSTSSMSSKATQQTMSQSACARTAGYIPASPNTPVSLHSSSMIQKTTRPSPLATPQSFQSTSNQEPTSSGPQVSVTSLGIGETTDKRQRTDQPHGTVPSLRSVLETQKWGPLSGDNQTRLEQQNDKASHMFTSQSQIPCSSPTVIPMETSPSQNSVDGSPDSKLHSSEGEITTGSPFNLEKHREKLKAINKSPGQPFFTSDRRMFEGGKVENNNNKEQPRSSFGKVLDNSSPFMLFGGGDGFGFTPFSEKRAENLSGLSGAGDQSNTKSSFSGDQMSKEPADKEEPMKLSFFGSGFNPPPVEDGGFNIKSQNPTSPQTTNFATMFGSSFNFGSFNSDAKSPSSGMGDTEAGENNFASLFGESSGNDENSNSGFTFNFGSFGSSDKSPTTEKFSFF